MRVPKVRNLKPLLNTIKPLVARSFVGEEDRNDRRDREYEWRKWYKTARWQKLRLEVLQRDCWTCQQTGEMLTGKYPADNSPVVDHIRPHRGDPVLFWDINNLQSITKQYHDSTKQKIEKGRK